MILPYLEKAMKSSQNLIFMTNSGWSAVSKPIWIIFDAFLPIYDPIFEKSYVILSN